MTLAETRTSAFVPREINGVPFIRGAVPYANYAAGPFLRELRREQQDAQQKVAEQGTGGGIALARAKAAEESLTAPRSERVSPRGEPGTKPRAGQRPQP